MNLPVEITDYGQDDSASGLHDEDAVCEFRLRCDSVKLLFAMVSAVFNMKKDQHGVISVNSTEVQFKVNISTLLECLSLYGLHNLNLTAAVITFSEADGVLHLLLEHSGLMSECDLVTVDVEGMMDYEGAFRSSQTVGKAVMRSDVLHECLKELCDQPGANTLVLTCSPREPFFRMHTYGGTGSCTFDLSMNSDAFLTFEVAEPVEFSYHLRMFEAGLRAVAASSQTFIRLNERGMLSLAHKIETEDGGHTIINFTIMPDESTGEEKLSQASTADNGSVAASNQGSDVVTTRRGATSNRSINSRSGGTTVPRGAADDLADFAAAAHRVSGGALQGINYLAGDFLSASGDGDAYIDQSAEVEY